HIVSLSGNQVTLSVDCSAGFYVRSLAHDLGVRLGIGAHLTALRRTRTGDFSIDRALTLDVLERNPAGAATALVPMSAASASWPSVALTADGIVRVGHGQDVRTIDHEPSALSPQPFVRSPQPFVRLLDSRGELLAIAEPTTSGTLHPSVVLM